MSSPMRCYGPAYCKAHAITRVIARVCASSASCTELKRYMDRLCCPCTRQPWMGRWLQHGINIFVQTDLHYECMHERIRYGMHALICVLFDCLNWGSPGSHHRHFRSDSRRASHCIRRLVYSPLIGLWLNKSWAKWRRWLKNYQAVKISVWTELLSCTYRIIWE